MSGLDLLLIVSGPQLILPVRLGDPGIRRLPLLLLSVAGESLPSNESICFRTLSFFWDTYSLSFFVLYLDRNFLTADYILDELDSFLSVEQNSLKLFCLIFYNLHRVKATLFFIFDKICIIASMSKLKKGSFLQPYFTH